GPLVGEGLLPRLADLDRAALGGSHDQRRAWGPEQVLTLGWIAIELWPRGCQDGKAAGAGAVVERIARADRVARRVAQRDRVPIPGLVPPRMGGVVRRRILDLGDLTVGEDRAADEVVREQAEEKDPSAHHDRHH